MDEINDFHARNFISFHTINGPLLYIITSKSWMGVFILPMHPVALLQVFSIQFYKCTLQILGKPCDPSVLLSFWAVLPNQHAGLPIVWFTEWTSYLLTKGRRLGCMWYCTPQPQVYSFLVSRVTQIVLPGHTVEMLLCKTWHCSLTLLALHSFESQD